MIEALGWAAWVASGVLNVGVGVYLRRTRGQSRESTRVVTGRVLALAGGLLLAGILILNQG